ncbi:DEAD/DEAH box helicase [Halorhodospira halophila]|uniref:DEAD/DEAH box helicase n=1 Tax=Halorhodospira halophila TaxID=1053 RepID=UPI00191351A5|nr:type ISP restriction/modification enzyme [Halorhodospira halophila]MBK5944850.1 damage-inducible protein [Halorhodospira halophila]
MTTTVDEVLERFRERAQSEREKGGLFERLVANYLMKDPKYADLFDQVWLWEEWPARIGADAGIDLVAREQATGDYWAIQCKFFDPDTAIQKSDIDSFFTASGKRFATDEGEHHFAHRLIVTTTEHWSKKAEEALTDQTIPVKRLFFKDLAESPIDWTAFQLDRPQDLRLRPKNEVRPHQKEALEDCLRGFEQHERGKLIMACGTGKTFTSLRLAEEMVPEGGRILFLAPSISLVGQTLREWTAQARVPLRALVACSDTKVSKDAEDLPVHDLAYPATTDSRKLALHGSEGTTDRRTVVFATYQSIQVVADAQSQGLGAFDLVICDEAHRTTGLTLPEENPSDFVKVHDNDKLAAHRRLYMTATPRIFAEQSKSKAEEKDAAIFSMDDEATFGPEFHRLSFGKAVARDLLTDYKVLIVAVQEETMASLANAYNQTYKLDDKKAIDINFATRMIGAWKGLSKRGLVAVDEHGEQEAVTEDTHPMQRAVAFSQSIKASKQTTEAFSCMAELYRDALPETHQQGLVPCELRHVDGTMNAYQRQVELEWLKEASEDTSCRILSNARCLSEGVDVPALDAVVFFDTRDSIVDIVQSVGRVMRKAPGKQYGYIILPVAIPATQVQNYNAYLESDPRFRGIWKVIKALRAHDESLVDEAEFRRKVNVVGGEGEEGEGEGSRSRGEQLTLDFPDLPVGQISEAVYAAIPKKLGDREYWSQWAKQVADIARRVTERIRRLTDSGETREAFEAFLKEVRANTNPNVREDEAIEMLAQHVVTRPVFEALFAESSFTKDNPISRGMEALLEALDEYAVSSETDELERFYAVIRERVQYAQSDKSRQEVIRNLYDTFFQNAFPALSDRLGIVYTPVEVVDFINRSADAILRTHFNRGLADQGVEILEPFAGTGTFVTRLIQSGLLGDAETLSRKYTEELHANEIVLLAYYIATLNIEATFHEWTGEKRPFEGMVLTDTFNMAEERNRDWEREQRWLAENSERARQQRESDIRVIVGNPPYSAWQASGHEGNANRPYPALDERIRETYVAQSSATLNNSLYDSYIRAIRWASDRIGDQGVIAFVTNGGFIDGNATEGVRRCLADDFSHVYVVNLRGNQRITGDDRHREGGVIFDAGPQGGGSKATIAIVLLVKDLTHQGDCRILYHDIGDYLSRTEKLEALEHFQEITATPLTPITPSPRGEWINQSDPAFDEFLAIGRKKEREGTAVFGIYSRGVMSGRDAWVYNFSREALRENMTEMIDGYNGEVEALREAGGANSVEEVKRLVDTDPSRIGWDRELFQRAMREQRAEFREAFSFTAVYRPFAKSAYYFDRHFNNCVYQMPHFFPTREHGNYVIAVTGTGASKPFSTLVTDCVPNLHMIDSSQCFPRYWYEYVGDQPGQTAGLLDDPAETPDEHGYIRRDAITDEALRIFQDHYADDSIAKDDIFWYVYGVLHSEEYRERFRNNLRRGLPRIPLAEDFCAFARAGRNLADLHLKYETVEPYPLEEEHKRLSLDDDDYRVYKMRFASSGRQKDKSAIIYNEQLTLRGIPLEAYEYQVNGKSAIEWVMERYQVSKDKKTGNVNDPNEYSDDPRYIVDLIKRLVRVSLETVRIVRSLPPLNEARLDK